MIYNIVTHVQKTRAESNFKSKKQIAKQIIQKPCHPYYSTSKKLTNPRQLCYKFYLIVNATLMIHTSQVYCVTGP